MPLTTLVPDRVIVLNGTTLRVVLFLVAVTLSAPATSSATTILEHLESFWSIPGARELAERGAAYKRLPIEVFVMELDVTRDGIPELFVGTTWLTSNRGLPWLVYMRQADGRYRPVGMIEFGPESFLYLASSSLIFTIGAAGGG